MRCQLSDPSSKDEIIRSSSGIKFGAGFITHAGGGSGWGHSTTAGGAGRVDVPPLTPAVGPAHVSAQIEAVLRQLQARAVLNVLDAPQSARFFAARFKGSDLLIARLDEVRADDDNEIESYFRPTVAMFIAAHRGIQWAQTWPMKNAAVAPVFALSTYE